MNKFAGLTFIKCCVNQASLNSHLSKFLLLILLATSSFLAPPQKANAFPTQTFYYVGTNGSLCGEGSASFTTFHAVYPSYSAVADHCISWFNGTTTAYVASDWRWDSTHTDKSIWAGGDGALPTIYNNYSSHLFQLFTTNTTTGSTSWVVAGSGTFYLWAKLTCPLNSSATSVLGAGTCGCSTGYYSYTPSGSPMSCVATCPTGTTAQGGACVDNSHPTCKGMWTGFGGNSYQNLAAAGNGSCLSQSAGLGTFTSFSSGTANYSCSGGGTTTATCSNYTQASKAVACTLNCPKP